MKKLIIIFLLVVSLIATACIHYYMVPPIENVIEKALARSVAQYKLLYKSVEKLDGTLPRSIGKDGVLETSDASFWTSGFFPGSLWYLYEYSNDPQLKEMADKITQRVESQQYNCDNHDVGFMINCSYGNKFRLTNDTSSVKVIVNAGKSLSTRFRKTVGSIRSWSHPESLKWEFPVIIDNMMNLELLIKAANLSGDKKLYEIAVSHANTTLKNHFRKDFSSYHVVSYDSITGSVQTRCTAQGYNDESAWSRGQAWGLYGYTMMYRETKDVVYLEQAKNIANFILTNKNLPDDKIPYWDFDDPNIPNALRDASAAAIMASAFVELSTFVDSKLAKKYIETAEKQIRSLASDHYLADLGTNKGFILKHSVGYLSNDSEVDVPLTYADYYFIEAMLRYKTLVMKE
ncbi:MAG: glucuronyl hydrolase [Paludibacter sp.]|nr:glucuronyl hydrolase [Paludibacter sp.]